MDIYGLDIWKINYNSSGSNDGRMLIIGWQDIDWYLIWLKDNNVDDDSYNND